MYHVCSIEWNPHEIVKRVELEEKKKREGYTLGGKRVGTKG
jgi:hypothetical protein